MYNTISTAALADLRRFYSYGWLPGRIAHVLNRMHGLTLTPQEVKQFCRANKTLLESSTSQRSESDVP